MKSATALAEGPDANTRAERSQDPLGYVDGLGLYEYVGSNPTGLLDPGGLAATTNPAQGLQDPVSTIYHDPTDPIYDLGLAKGAPVATIWMIAKGVDLGTGKGKVMLEISIKQATGRWKGSFGRDVLDSGALIIDKKTIRAFREVSDKEAVARDIVLFSEESMEGGFQNDCDISREGDIWLMQVATAGGKSRTNYKGKWNGDKFAGQPGVNAAWKYSLSYRVSGGKLAGELKFSVKEVFLLVNKNGDIEQQFADYGDYFDYPRKEHPGRFRYRDLIDQRKLEREPPATRPATLPVMKAL